MSEQSTETASTVKKVVMTDLEKWLEQNKINMKPDVLKELCECKRLYDIKLVTSFAQSKHLMTHHEYEDKILPRAIHWEDSDFLMYEGLRAFYDLSDHEMDLVEKFCADYIEDKKDYFGWSSDDCKESTESEENK